MKTAFTHPQDQKKRRILLLRTAQLRRNYGARNGAFLPLNQFCAVVAPFLLRFCAVVYRLCSVISVYPGLERLNYVKVSQGV